MRINEVGVDRQRFTILRDRFVKSAHLQQQFGVGIVGIRIARNQFYIFLECQFGVRVIGILSIGITKNVEGTRVSRIEFGSFLVVADCLRHVLLAGVVAAQVEMSALVIWMGGHELIEQLFLFRGVAVGAGFISQDKQLLAVRRFVCQAHGMLQVFEELFSSGADVGPIQMGQRKVRTSEIALSKCWIES